MAGPDTLAFNEIRYVDLGAQFAEERADLMAIVERVLASGDYVGGDAVGRLEDELAAFVGMGHCVAVNSGTDALALAMRCLGIGPGDEVITPPNSFIASTGAIVQIGARPVFVDVGDDYNLEPERIEAAITPATKAIMPVHLTGRICDMDRITPIAARHGLAVVEDAAQSIGSLYKGRKAGSFGDAGCFSSHPLKNLNSCGDGGFITTNDGALAERARRLRNHGLADRSTAPEFGCVSRMDVLHAEILRYRLEKRLAHAIERRRANVALYRAHLDRRHVDVPECRDHEYNTYVLFMVQIDRRDALQQRLRDLGIGTAVHYPTPIHLQPAAAHLGYRAGDFPVAERQAARILSLPNHPYATEEQIRTVCEAINGFFA